MRRGDATTLATVQPSQPARLATTDDVPNRVPAAAGESATVDALVERGITSLVAHRLRQSCPAERIARQVAIFDVLREQDPDDPRLTPGRLRRQIEEDWAVPTGFDAKTFAAGADRPEVTAAAPQAEAPHTVAGTATVGRLTAAAAARRDELAAVGLGEDDQALWARVVQAAPVLPPLFRGALFHAPQGDDPAVVIFPSRADYDRALSPLHTATRARIAARLAAMTPAAPGRDGATTTVRYLVYADLLGMIRGE